MRGELTGIAVSATAIGDGVNVDNIRRCFDILVDIGYDGIVSIECEGQGGPMIEKSLAWVRELVDDANRRMSKWRVMKEPHAKIAKGAKHAKKNSS